MAHQTGSKAATKDLLGNRKNRWTEDRKFQTGGLVWRRSKLRTPANEIKGIVGRLVRMRPKSFFEPVGRLVRNSGTCHERWAFRNPHHFAMEVWRLGCTNGRNCRCQICRLVSSKCGPTARTFHWVTLEQTCSICPKLVRLLVGTWPRHSYPSIVLSRSPWYLQL